MSSGRFAGATGSRAAGGIVVGPETGSVVSLTSTDVSGGPMLVSGWPSPSLDEHPAAASRTSTTRIHSGFGVDTEP